MHFATVNKHIDKTVKYTVNLLYSQTMFNLYWRGGRGVALGIVSRRSYDTWGGKGGDLNGACISRTGIFEYKVPCRDLVRRHKALMRIDELLPS